MGLVTSCGARWPGSARIGDPADVFVFHEPNEPSGGTPSCIELLAFLGSGVASPELRAPLAMAGPIVEADHPIPTGTSRGTEPGAAGAEPTPGAAADPT